MAYSSPKSKLSWFVFSSCALLVIFSLDKKTQNLFPKLFKKWHELPLSSQKGWKRGWFAFLGTSIIFISVPVFEQIFKPISQEQSQVAQPQTQEQCTPGLNPTSIYCLIIRSELLKLAESFSIVLAAWIFILERQDRQEQAQREDWSLIDGARGSETSGARFSAIRRLHQDKVSLKGLDAEEADLYKIELENADLERANLRNTDLQRSNLAKANLQEANLREANFKQADLQEANLWSADLRGANLKEADLRKARLGRAKLQRVILRGTNLEGADLRGARFHGADLRGAIIVNANLAQAEFLWVKNLTLEQIKSANNWDRAIFGQDIFPENTELRRQKSGNSQEELDKIEASDQDCLQQQREILKKLNELRVIENLLEEINQKKSLSKEELINYLEKNSHEIPEVNSIQEMISKLDDIQELKKAEIEDLIDDLKNNIRLLKQSSDTQEK